jgi:ubiquinol-cytochrome c reductase iron-sulfur subunit
MLMKREIDPTEKIQETKRDFLYLTTAAMGAVAAGAAIWPFVDSMNPAADVLALSTTEIDISQVVVGQAITVMWRGSPVFIRRRTEEEIKVARDVELKSLPDPQKDEDRVKKDKDEWLVLVGVCTHLGCVPGNKASDSKGDFGGWLCPCHGSHYDTSGRIRKGPAPHNLAIPPYQFTNEKTLLIG